MSNKAHDNRKFEDHKGRSFSVKGKEGDWHGQELEVKSDPVIDPGMGKPYVLRAFKYAINPEVKFTPTKQDLFNYHWKEIRFMLWKDGFVHCEESEPRVHVTKKTYTIFVLAKPRVGVSVFEKPNTLQDILKTK